MEITQIMKVISDAILCAAPAQKMRARVTRDGTICAKNSTFGNFEGASPIAEKIYPVHGLLPRLWLLP